jgi:hypothetical protein
MNEFERNRDIAIVVRKQAARVVVRAVIDKQIDLDIAYQISCLAESEQEPALQEHLKPPVEKTLLEKFQEIWAAASAEERAAAMPAIAECVGVSNDEKLNCGGALFPDAVEDVRNTKRVEPTEAEFEAFWKAFPCRVNKGNARKAFTRAFGRLRKTKNCEQVITIIMNGANVYAKNANPERLCHPTTWLNGDRWTDEAESIWTGDRPKAKTGNATFGTYTDEERATLQDAVF